MDILSELNKEQKSAVTQVNGPMMVIAGAGSGKTRVLTYRIAHLIEKGVDPFNILALTFTNKAAKEMKSRIGELIGNENARNIWMGTFHSIFAKILRIEADKLNYPRNFTIYDSADTKSLLKTIIKELGLNDKIYKPSLVYGRISSAKNNLIGARDYINNPDIKSEDLQSGKPRLGEIYYQYEQRCIRASAMDFDDLLFKTNILLKKYPETLLKYQHKFKYILVDEYQDTNYSQYLIVKQLAAVNENLCVVGDDAQSIYAFRGANIQNILNFKLDYPDFKLFKLEQNYRSTQIIVDAANSVIKKNKDQISKKVWTANGQGGQIKVQRLLSDNEEGRYVANRIFEIQQEEKCEALDFAILYRTNAQSRSFEESLRKLNIPYRIYGGLSFYQRKEIKDLIAYFRLTANHNDEEALKRIINYPARGIGKTSLEKSLVCAADNQTSIWNVIAQPAQHGLQLGAAAINKLQDFVTMITSFRAELETKSAYDLGEHIAKSSGLFRELYADKSPEGVNRYENIQELLNGLKEFSENTNPNDPEKPNTLSDFLLDVALLTDADQNDSDDNKVSLMTIHAAKGLEFPHVFVVGMEENLFPSQLALHSRTELEEERRLFYVALTRAEKSVSLTYAVSRYRWGNLIHSEASRFIEEIDPEYLDVSAGASLGSPRGSLSGNDRSITRVQGHNPFQTNTRKASLSKLEETSKKEGTQSEENKDIQIGMEVIHERFGKGKVLQIEGSAPNAKATVFFPSAGQKQLLLKFARLKIV